MKKLFSVFAAMLFGISMAATAANVYFVNTDGWSAVNVYMWGATDADKNAAWPGVAMTKTSEQAHGKDVYSYEVPSSPAGLVNIIFNNKVGNDGPQTTDLKYDAAKPYYYNLKWYATLADVEAASDQIEMVTLYFVNKDNWEKVQAYAFEGGNSYKAWPGETMTKTGEKALDKDIYSYSFPVNYTKVIFNNKVGDVGTQTGDLTWSAAKPYYYDGEWFASKEAIQPSAPAKFYITGDAAALGSWNPAAIKSTEDSYTLNLAAGSYQLKVTLEGNWDEGKVKGFSDLSEKAEGLTEGKDNNICFTLAEAGSVKVTYTSSVFKLEGKFTAGGGGGETPDPTPDPGTGDYYLKNNWGAGADWTWKAMAKDGDNYKLENVVFGGSGVNVNTKAEECEDCWIGADAFLGDKIAARDTVTLVLNPSASPATITATLLGKYVPKGDVVYYLKNNWDAGEEWSWKEMTKDGDTYKLENVTFGGTGVNYGTIASGDGEGWIPVADFKGDQIYAKDVVNLTFNPADKTITAKLITSGGGKPADPANFYLVGSFSDWKANDLYKFAANPGAAGEYVLLTTLNAGDKLKVLGVADDQSETWYPDGMGNEYTVDEANAGNVTVYFRPAKNADWTLLTGYIAIVKAQGIGNTSDGVKAVKAFENGTLVIIKNGVKYNAQGTVIR